MEKKKYERNYWPHAIVISIFLIIGACVWTIIIALDNPVEMDDFYLQKYQDVDKNINLIIKKQKDFFTKYNIVNKTQKFDLNKKNNIVCSLIDKNSSKKIENAKVIFHLTRPETTKLDKTIVASLVDGEYIAKDVELKKLGRWQLKVKATIGSNEGFKEYEYEVYDAKAQKEYFDKYSLNLVSSEIKYGAKNSIKLNLLDKLSKKPLRNAKIFIQLSHPDGKKFNKIFKAKFDGKSYVHNTKTLRFKGDWKLRVRVEYDSKDIFKNFTLKAM